MWIRTLPTLTLLFIAMATPGHTAEPTCQASEGNCIITGYYDYDPQQLEVGILIEPLVTTNPRSTLFPPELASRAQQWNLTSPEANCQTSKLCDNGATLSCYAPAPCGGGESSDTLWCGQYVEGGNTLAGSVHLCLPLGEEDPYDGDDLPPPEPPTFDYTPSGPAPLPAGAPPIPPGGGLPACSHAEFLAANQAQGPWAIQIQERTTQREARSALGPGNYPSFTTISHDTNATDMVNTVHASAIETQHMRIQDGSLYVQLDTLGWIGVPDHLTRSMMGPMASTNPSMFASHVPWEDHIGRTLCPRSSTQSPANQCMVFRNETEDLFFVHQQSCRLEHIQMRNDNGPVTVAIYWLNGSYRFDRVAATRQMSGNPFTDEDIFTRMSEGRGAVDHRLHELRDFQGAGLAER